MIKGFHKEGNFILISTTIICIVLVTVSFIYMPSWVFYITILASLVVLILFFQFFRVPSRAIIALPNAIISPADGKVVVIEEVYEPEFLKEKCTQISIFMSPLNVHINWYPISGKVIYDAYHPGKFLVAWHPKSSTDNERTTVAMQHDNGKRIVFRQVAGAVARRIVCYAKKENSANQANEFGFIKFGSRIDVYIPLDAKIKVSLDQKVIGTQTIIAEF
ncbi:MAG: phosphatidylserine decarboxylase [Patiriisocius sp.]|jgi:phosphatidylserine decarboxylase